MAHPNLPEGANYTNAFEIAADLESAGPMAARKVAAVLRHYGQLLETRVKARASFPAGEEHTYTGEGPRTITGDYRRSINSRLTSHGDEVTVTVGTNRPQARRLEFGFVGEDRAGRVYHEGPLPHFGPAFDQTAPEVEDAIDRIPYL
jgi:hypothetical protein